MLSPFDIPDIFCSLGFEVLFFKLAAGAFLFLKFKFVNKTRRYYLSYPYDLLCFWLIIIVAF